jgi:hypothetical protein
MNFALMLYILTKNTYGLLQPETIDLTNYVLKIPTLSKTLEENFFDFGVAEIDIELTAQDLIVDAFNKLGNSMGVIEFYYNNQIIYVGVVDKVSSKYDVVNKTVKLRSVDLIKYHLDRIKFDDPNLNLSVYQFLLQDQKGLLRALFGPGAGDYPFISFRTYSRNWVYKQYEGWDNLSRNRQNSDLKRLLMNARDLLVECLKFYGHQIWVETNSWYYVDDIYPFSTYSVVQKRNDNPQDIFQILDYISLETTYAKGFKQYVVIPFVDERQRGNIILSYHIGLIDIVNGKFMNYLSSDFLSEIEDIREYTEILIPLSPWVDNYGNLQPSDYQIAPDGTPFIWQSYQYINPNETEEDLAKKVADEFFDLRRDNYLIKIELPGIDDYINLKPLNFCSVVDLGIIKILGIEFDFENFKTTITGTLANFKTYINI